MFIGDYDNVFGAVLDFALSSIRSFSLQTLLLIRRRALRFGIWFRVEPLRRALLDATIAYLRSGRIIKSLRLLGMVREALAEVLALLIIRKTSTLAYIIGTKILGMVGKTAVIAGIQWLNTPLIYRTQEARNTQ